MIKLILKSALALLMLVSMAAAEPLKLVLPQNSMADYAVEFIETALDAQGIEHSIEVEGSIPIQRFEGLLSSGEPNYAMLLLWRRTVDRAVVVPVNMTNGLIGQRVLFTRADLQDEFSAVQTLDDLRQSGLIGGFGANWYDVRVWHQNGLRTREVEGDWRVIYEVLPVANRGIDYFSRGILEMAVEQDQYPELHVETDLLLSYEGDFNLFLSPSTPPEHADILESALEAAIASGVQDQLLRKHFPDVFDEQGLNFDGRLRIDLESP